MDDSKGGDAHVESEPARIGCLLPCRFVWQERGHELGVIPVQRPGPPSCPIWRDLRRSILLSWRRPRLRFLRAPPCMLLVQHSPAGGRLALSFWSPHFSTV